MYLATKTGRIREVPEKKPLKALFCRHRNTMCGEQCGANGMRRISGLDSYTVCLDCGTVLDELHIDCGG